MTQGGKLNKKHEPTICCLQESHARATDTHRLKVKRWEKISCKWKRQKNRGLYTHIKIDFKTRAIKKRRTLDNDKRISIRGFTLVSLDAPNVGVP